MALATALVAFALLAGDAPDSMACAPDTAVVRSRALPTGDSVRVLQTILFPKAGGGAGTMTIEYLSTRPETDSDGLRVEAAALAAELAPAASAAGVRPTLAVVRVCHPTAPPPATALTRQFRFVPGPSGNWVPAVGASR
jgi:hypothetical protein